MTFSGDPTIFGIDPYSESSTPVHNVGVKGVSADGRIFRYAKANAVALSVGRLCVAADVTANHEDITVARTHAVGVTSIILDIGGTAVDANDYDNGYLVINDDAGEGHTYLIKSHGSSSAGSEEVTFVISPGLVVGTTIDVSDATIIRNPHREILQSNGNQNDVPIGITPIAITADFFFWVQTGGVCAVLTDGTIATTAGQPVTIGAATSGAVEVVAAVTDSIVGEAFVGFTPTTDGEHNPILLTLDR